MVQFLGQSFTTDMYVFEGYSTKYNDDESDVKLVNLYQTKGPFPSLPTSHHLFGVDTSREGLPLAHSINSFNDKHFSTIKCFFFFFKYKVLFQSVSDTYFFLPV